MKCDKCGEDKDEKCFDQGSNICKECIQKENQKRQEDALKMYDRNAAVDEELGETCRAVASSVRISVSKGQQWDDT